MRVPDGTMTRFLFRDKYVYYACFTMCDDHPYASYFVYLPLIPLFNMYNIYQGVKTLSPG